MRFLVTHGRQKTPVQVIRLGNLLEDRRQGGQPVSNLFHELKHANPVKLVTVLVIAVLYLGQLAGFLEEPEERAGFLHQRIIIAGQECPGLVLVICHCKADF